MFLIPAIYFTLLTAYWWIRHQRLDVCVYMSALYALTAWCAVPVVMGGMLDEAGILFDEYNLELGFVPTVLYCALLTLGMLPFSYIYGHDIKEVKQSSSIVLECCCWLLFAVFLLNFYLIVDSTVEILSGDLSSVRNDHYQGIQSPAEVKAESLPVYVRYLFYFNTTTILALPLFFYYSCFTNRPWWFKTLLLATSLSMSLSGLQQADRTEFMFYGLMFIYCLLFFWKFLSKGFKRGLVFVGSPLMILVLIYLVAVTQARFAQEDDNQKAVESTLQYAGQNYLYFCYFWEYARSEYISPEREFPMTWHTLFNIDSSPERREVRSGEHGFFISVFATYIGDVMLDLSPLGAIIWALCYFLLCISIIRYHHREVFDVGDVLAIFVLAVIPIFGIFYYRYYSYFNFYLFALTFIIFIFQKLKVVYDSREQSLEITDKENVPIGN